MTRAPHRFVILTKIRTQSHERRRPQLWILDQVQDDGSGRGAFHKRPVILTKVRTQSHERPRPQLWILDQVQDDGGGEAPRSQAASASCSSGASRIM